MLGLVLCADQSLLCISFCGRDDFYGLDLLICLFSCRFSFKSRLLSGSPLGLFLSDRNLLITGRYFNRFDLVNFCGLDRLFSENVGLLDCLISCNLRLLSLLFLFDAIDVSLRAASQPESF